MNPCLPSSCSRRIPFSPPPPVYVQIFNVLVPIALKMAVDDVGTKTVPVLPVILYGEPLFNPLVRVCLRCP